MIVWCGSGDDREASRHHPRSSLIMMTTAGGENVSKVGKYWPRSQHGNTRRLCVRASQSPAHLDAETRVMWGLACWRDSISIIETLGPLSMSRMRLQFLSYISHLSILRWLGMRGECEASDWSLSRQHGPLIGCEDAGGWSGSGWWWWPRYEYSGSITNGGKKPAESLAPIQTQGSQDWKQGNMMFMSMSCQLSMSTIMQIFHLIADGLLYVCTEEFFCC